MRMETISLVVTSAGFLITLVGLGYVVYDHHVLTERLVQLIEKASPLAVATSPDRSTVLSADEASSVKGVFLRDPPEQLHAVLLNHGQYYISHPRIERRNIREWVLDIHPGEGKWSLCFVHATIPQAQKDLENWRDEKVAPGSNPRPSLPAGTKEYFVEEYNCARGSMAIQKR